jgi:iron complex transport system substrate-binding protein
MRMICLSAESADICAKLGAWENVVAVSAYASQVGLARKPVVSSFSKADLAKVAAYQPDLVITFSDVQAEIAAAMIREGITVLATNQRTLTEISATIRLIGGAIGRPDEAAELAGDFMRELEALKFAGERRPRIYFEEWPDPMTSGIAWVSEIIEWVGGIDICANQRGSAARERQVNRELILAADPEIIIASWCGKPVDFATIRAREGFEHLDAVRTGRMYEIHSDLLLQPGPRVLDGARAIRKVIDQWRLKTGV